MEPAHRLISLTWIGALRGTGAVALVAWFLAGQLGIPGAPPLWYLAIVGPMVAAGATLLHPWAGHPVSDTRVASALALDILALTALLIGTDGSGSPYALLYIFPVVLAGMAVPPGLAWFLLVLAVGVYASLFVFAPANLHHHDASAMQAHLLGMWVTVLLVGGLTVFSFGRMRAQMAALDRRLHNARELEARNTRLGALATLAAGAAHELATPLSTILLVAREMQRTAAHARQRDDADLVASEVLRCQDVLAQLSANAGEGLGEAPSRTHLAPYLAEALVPIADPRVTVQAQDKTVFLPSRLVAQVVRRLVGNALAASGPKEPVTVAAHVEGLTLEICVKDQGVGMPPEVLARAGEPFFTTRPPGEGRGLGLYFARSVATGLGGALDITSAPGRGTTVRFSVPVELA